MLLVQVSDLHLDGSPARHERAERVMAYVNDLTGVAAVLVSGDIADHGAPSEYEEARALLASPHRMLTCPGNHDVRGPYESVLLGRPPSGAPVNEAHYVAGVLVAMCDSSRPGRADGLLDDDTLAWLDGVLTDRPALVCFHHPPAPMHQPSMAAMTGALHAATARKARCMPSPTSCSRARSAAPPVTSGSTTGPIATRSSP